MSNITKFENYLQSTNIKGIDELIEYFQKNGFYSSPASSQYHLCNEGGLLEHSLNVLGVALTLPMALDVNRNDLIIACLLHDVGKMGAFGESMYLPNILKSGKISEAKPWETNKSIGMEHQDLSLIILSKFIDLTREQAFAIKYHNGLYTPDGRSVQGKETKLMMIVHFADMWASRVLEG